MPKEKRKEKGNTIGPPEMAGKKKRE